MTSGQGTGSTAPAREAVSGAALDSAILNAAILNGARIVRVHDVRAIRRAALIADAVRSGPEGF